MDKFILIAWGFCIGFLSSSIYWRIYADQPVWLSVVGLVLVFIALAARLINGEDDE